MTQSVDWQASYPFRSHWIEHDGLRQHYLDEGGGRPLLMVHGNPTWSFYWRRLVQAFSARARVVVPDHVGCGLSDKPRGVPIDLARHTAHLVRLVEQLDLRNVTLVCHDWGGPIGLGAAVELAERFDRLVILNTGAFPPPYIPWRIRACRIPLLGRWAVQGLNLFARAATRMAVADRSRLSAEAKAGLLAPYDRWAHREGIYRFVADIPASPRHPSWAVLERLEQRLPSLADRPVQLIWGMRDWCFRPECLRRLHALFPGAEVHELEDVGHYVVEEAPQRVIDLMETFLQLPKPDAAHDAQ